MLSVLYTFIVLFAVCIEYYKFSALLIFIFGSTVYEELVIVLENNL